MGSWGARTRWHMLYFQESGIGLARLAGVPLAVEPTLISPTKEDCHHATKCLQGSWILLCDSPFPGETQHTCSPQIGNPQQTEVRVPPESTLVNQCTLLRLFTRAEVTQRRLHHQSHVGMVTAHKAGDLQAAHEVGECSIQVPQLV